MIDVFPEIVLTNDIYPTLLEALGFALSLPPRVAANACWVRLLPSLLPWFACLVLWGQAGQSVGVGQLLNCQTQKHIHSLGAPRFVCCAVCVVAG